VTYDCATESETLDLAAKLARAWGPGDVVLLEGELGAGKTTFVRGVLRSLGHLGAVRSPTFNLLQTFPTDPPVLHADLYRLSDASGTGIEDYLDDHLCLIEWPDRMASVVPSDLCWRIRIEFVGEGRRIHVDSPARA